MQLLRGNGYGLACLEVFNSARDFAVLCFFDRTSARFVRSLATIEQSMGLMGLV